MNTIQYGFLGISPFFLFLVFSNTPFNSKPLLNYISLSQEEKNIVPSYKLQSQVPPQIEKQQVQPNPAHLEQLLKTKSCKECDLRNADLKGLNLKDVNLEDANLEGANLEKANLKRAYLVRTNLQNANLKQADITDVNMSYGNFKGANLTQADLNPDKKYYAQSLNTLYSVLIGANLTYSNPK